MWISHVLLRWYKSFNVASDKHQSVASSEWDVFRNEQFPFTRIPLDRHITTVVGANEAGKSHLLSAIAKSLNGHADIGGEPKPYELSDICRYCAFDKLDDEVWPRIGIGVTPQTAAEATQLAKILEVEVPAGTEVVFILDGAHAGAGFVTAHIVTGSTQQRAQVDREKWFEFTRASFPRLAMIESHVALSNEVHVSQLLEMYANEPPSPMYDPIALQTLAAAMQSIPATAKQSVDEATAAELQRVRAALSRSKIGPDKTGMLEALLFRDVLSVSKRTLEQIRNKGVTDRGYVERIVGAINHRISEELDIAKYWQQDENFNLHVDYKGGIFYFVITDKTGHVYTFNERSSGLRYFLSYYIQALAIEKSHSKNGSIILMDEPDSFLSASGQRNLLSVFDRLVDPKRSSGTCQLVYTTHSPFLINRNFPQRIRLVRKGEGAEGTQYVEAAVTRRYEPVRSALGADHSDTLFLGSTNIIVEGTSDQKIIVAGIQKYGNPKDLSALLDLNRVTFVSAGGASHVRTIVERSMSPGERKPVVVALLDNDNAGNLAYQEIVQDKVLKEEFITTLETAGVENDILSDVHVIEDIIPSGILGTCCQHVLMRRWKVNGKLESEVVAALQKAIPNGNSANAIKAVAAQFIQSSMYDEATTAEEFRAAVTDQFIDDLVFSDRFDNHPGIGTFKANIERLCGTITLMIDEAELRSQHEMMERQFKFIINAFMKAHRNRATKSDVRRCLRTLELESRGTSDDTRQARDNVNALVDRLESEVSDADAEVDVEIWRVRLSRLRDGPLFRIEWK